MKTSMMSAPVLALALVLAGCGNQADTPADGTAAVTGAGAGQSAPASLKHGKAVGTVTAIDPGKGSVTLDHGAIADLNWPPMEMGFAAKPDQLAGLEVGDKVDFEIDWDGKTGSVTSIRKAR
ncbi:MAG: copper-binding protein [Qipengyuania sp.]|nr:copper-binding protein [Qipengyuania sp.]